MIPTNSQINDYTITVLPTRTYCMDLTGNTILGYTDEQKAMQQAIYKILRTERYQHIIYSWNYGIETWDLYGKPCSYVCPELKRRITEALTWDDRIESVTDFSFSFPGKRTIYAKFTVHTIYGDIETERAVNF